MPVYGFTLLYPPRKSLLSVLVTQRRDVYGGKHDAYPPRYPVDNKLILSQTHSQSPISHDSHGHRCQRHQRLAASRSFRNVPQPNNRTVPQTVSTWYRPAHVAHCTREAVWVLSRTLPFRRRAGLWLWVDQRIIGGVDDPVCVRPHWPRGPHVIGDAEYAPNQSKSARHQAQRAWT